MSRAASPSADKPYGVARVCEEWGVARSTLYATRARRHCPTPPRKRGPKTRHSDAELTDHIRRAIETSPFTGEGYRKLWARLRYEGIRAGKPRILRLMREAGLLAPYRAMRQLGPRHHDGVIVTDAPDVMWGTDATGSWTEAEGHVTVFVVVDHCTDELLGVHAAKPATRFEALEPLRQAVRRCYGGFAQNIAQPLVLRHDHGSQFMSDDYQREIRFLGIAPSPSFIRSPEGNGVAERFIRTLKEQLLWVRTFPDLESLNLALQQWRELYNEQWLIQRHGHRSPAQVRRDFLAHDTAA